MGAVIIGDAIEGMGRKYIKPPKTTIKNMVITNQLVESLLYLAKDYDYISFDVSKIRGGWGRVVSELMRLGRIEGISVEKEGSVIKISVDKDFNMPLLSWIEFGKKSRRKKNGKTNK